MREPRRTKKPPLPCPRCGHPFVGAEEDHKRCANCFNPKHDEDDFPQAQEEE